MENRFNFWFPIEKAQEIIDPDTGEVRMLLGGIASTADEDSDGEFLDPKGFDIEPLLKSGMVNWHHQAKDQPAAIIGEPIKAEIQPEGLYVETELYPSSKIAQEVWQLAQILEKDSKTRRLGYSVEGKVLKRKSEDKNSPDYKKIQKALITGVAITHQPKNPKTFVNIIKGDVDDDEAEEDIENTEKQDNDKEKQTNSDSTKKGLTTETGKALIKESVDKKLKKQTFGKAEIFDKLFNDLPAINFNKANKIYLLLQKIAKMEGKNYVTEEDIQKAYDALGIEFDSEDIEKACGSKKNELEKDLDTKRSKKKEEMEEEFEEDEDEDEEEEEMEEEEMEEEIPELNKIKKSMGVNRFDRIEKAMTASHQINAKYIKALGMMVKDVSQKLEDIAEREEELLDIIKSQEDTISSLEERLEEFGSSVPTPKSLSAARPVERIFAKGFDNEFGVEREFGGRKNNQVSMSKQANVVAEILDQATFAKGFDDEFSRAVTHFEASKTLPSNIIARIKNEFGIEIVK